MNPGLSAIKKILITGSSGTIGTRLGEQLLSQGYDVRGVDWRDNKWVKELDQLTIKLDLRNRQAVLKKLPGDVDLIIHLAANARVYNLVLEPTLARDNFETLFNTLEFARLNKIKRFIFASSREVYGNSDKLVHSEDEAYVKLCESPYTASKIGGEALLHSYHQCYGIDFIIFRFSNVYGRYDDSDRVIPLFIKLGRDDKELTIFGQDKLFDFTYIDDAVNGVLSAIEKFNQVKNEVFNLASGQGVSILEVAKLIKQNLHSSSVIKIKQNRPGEVVKYVADISKARKLLNYKPQTDITEGIKQTIKWYLENV